MKEDFCNEEKIGKCFTAAAMGTTALVGFGTTAYEMMMFWNFTMDITRMRASGLQSGYEGYL